MSKYSEISKILMRIYNFVYGDKTPNNKQDITNKSPLRAA